MKKTLDEYGVCFKNGDDRTDNIGKLPSGRLVVLDGGALQLKEGCTLKPEFLDDWLQKVHQDMGEIYGASVYNHEIQLVGDTPDFNEHYSPLALQPTEHRKKHSDHRPTGRLSFGEMVKNKLHGLAHRN